VNTTDNSTYPSVTFNCTKDDFATAFQLHYVPTRSGWIVCALIILIGYTAFFFFLRSDGAPLSVQILLPLCVPIGGVLSAIFGWAIYMPWAGRRMHARQPLAHIPKSLALRAEGLHTQSERGESTMLWQDFIWWRANSKTTLLYLSPCMFILVPARLAALGFPIDDLKGALEREIGPPRVGK
jgi:hypothetical protein